MDTSGIDAIRALLGSKPRPAGWTERRERINEVGSVWPVSDDVKLTPADCNGVPGEWSIVPGSDASRVLLFFHGSDWCPTCRELECDFIKSPEFIAYARPLIEGEVRVPIEEGLPQYAVLEKVKVDKKLPARALA